MNQLVLILFLSLSAVLLQVQCNDSSIDSSNDLSNHLTNRNLTNYCPGMHVWCPSDESCCRSDESSYQYMCCQYSDGVCCDKRFNHCCDRGQYCTQWGCQSLTEGDERPVSGALLSEPLPQSDIRRNTVCPDKTKCTNTCCQQAEGVYGCCPVPSGVCCKDQAFCCPKGYQCTDSSCVITGGELPLISIITKDKKSEKEEEGSEKEEEVVLEKRIEQFEQVSNILAFNISTHCDDGSRCHDHQTCCPTGTGAFNCCPYPSAVCCPNGKACCPPGFTCDIDSCTFDTASTSVRLSKSQQNTLNLLNDVADTFNIMNNVADGVEDLNSEYPIYCGKGSLCTGNKCCKIPGTEIYSCCPYEGGKCCSTYCCPLGYSCGNFMDPEGIPCIPTTAKLRYNTPQDIKCSDDISTCSDGHTCCPKSDNTFNCAPFPNATCCSDGIHACPENFFCEEDTNLCKPKSTPEIIDFIAANKRIEETKKNKKMSPESNDLGKIICDEEMECGDNQTCCLLPDTTFGCCPFPDAICCADRQHCCEQGYHCHRSDHWKCAKNPSINTTDPDSPTFKDATSIIKSFASLISPHPLTHQCNKKFRCPNSATCCIRDDGSYACCPYEDAVCCPDKEHCCRSGSHCDMEHQTCVNNTKSIPFGSKFPATQNGPQSTLPDVTCSDMYTCPAHTTCCALSDGSFGCCPYVDAVCCDDDSHCCPHGYICNMTVGSCQLPGEYYLKLEKRPEENIDTSVAITSDPDLSETRKDQIFCKDGRWCKHQCCKSILGWGCCPLKDGICCQDGIHCCPKDEGCSVNGACNNSTLLVVTSSLTSLMKEVERPYTVLNSVLKPKLGLVPCNRKYSCPDGTTCCSIEEGEFGCCGYTNATCCIDKIHCCPQGYTCDLDGATCVQGREVMPMLAKNAPITKGEPLDYPSGSVEPLPKEQQLCPDNTSSCDVSDTCCVVPGGDYGCCPLQNATCCADSWHCCPPDMHCLGIFGVCYSFNEHGGKIYKDWLSLEIISEDHIRSRRNILP